MQAATNTGISHIILMESGEEGNPNSCLGNASNDCFEPQYGFTNSTDLWAQYNLHSQQIFNTLITYHQNKFSGISIPHGGVMFDSPMTNTMQGLHLDGVIPNCFNPEKTLILDDYPWAEKSILDDDLNNRSGRTKRGSLSKGQWTKEEDRKLVELVELYGLKKWVAIAEHMEGRIGKQCRERWHNHLRPNIKKDVIWTEAEEWLMVEAHQRFGNKWAEIAKYIPGRTENAIKNHWNATVRKQFTKRKTKKSSEKPNRPMSSSTVLKDYIKSKYFSNKESTSKTSKHILIPSSVQSYTMTMDDNNCDMHKNNGDNSVQHFLLEKLDEEIDFLKTLFKKNSNSVSMNSSTIS